jgi:predicted adenine nucleotide alpha hydrolase (AANH) superfamily ATPase
LWVNEVVLSVVTSMSKSDIMFYYNSSVNPHREIYVR